MTLSRPLSVLATTWLAEKNLSGHSGNRKNSDATRQDDLVRFCRAIKQVTSGVAAASTPFTLAELDELDVEHFDHDVMVQALTVLVDRYAQSTVARTLNSFSQWTRWMSKRGDLPADPCDEVAFKFKAPGVVPDGKHFSPDEVARLRAAAASGPESSRQWSVWPALDVAVLEVLLSCGLRAEEVVQLSVGAFDVADEFPMLRLRAGVKGSVRDVPMPAATVDAVQTYLAERRSRAARDPRWSDVPTSPLFVREVRSGPNKGVQPLDRSWLTRLMQRLTSQAGVARKPGALVHATRHTMGIELAKARISPFLIATLMGHSSPTISFSYIRHGGAEAAEALRDAGLLD